MLGKQVLVIDDEESVRNVLARILSQVNHRITVAESGEEGIRLFSEKEFDIVLMILCNIIMLNFLEFARLDSG